MGIEVGTNLSLLQLLFFYVINLILHPREFLPIG
jgi:hypothetical protein